uniref:Uncharacterized protein n=1 Tax=Chromera velia CCMP2878 TaxID=1169474 RepID=A0A0G4I1A1_9ALVE|eukprot:Cvel_27.t1-p1 / transcript=Cvel_27.t1 / gene=Cvel_27 / organism=Chromera_velia_CCMP2878 / gene_product=hypothetical protein / transcript_product=hypothetical protein / location=Cvel_scaffold5:162920-163909(+) / protein_length=330 / sequence_SO=supercontig / SO=protein_coding / is_pseudo=false
MRIVESVLVHLRDTVMVYPSESSIRFESLRVGRHAGALPGFESEGGPMLSSVSGPRRVVLAGSSAGGIGVALISDEIRDSVFRPSSDKFVQPAEGPLAQGDTVSRALRERFFEKLQSTEMLAIPQSGLYFPEGIHFGFLRGSPQVADALSPRAACRGVLSWAFSDSFLFDNESVDWDVVRALRKTKVRTLVVANSLDRDTRARVLWPQGERELNEWRKAAVKTARSLADSEARISFFMPPCTAHTDTPCVGNSGTTVNGMNYSEALRAFINGITSITSRLVCLETCREFVKGGALTSKSTTIFKFPQPWHNVLHIIHAYLPTNEDPCHLD